MISKDQLLAAVRRDPALTYEEKEELIDKINDANFYNSIVNGAIGGSIGFAIAKFFGLSKQAQVLLSLAGFGIGKYLLDATRKHDRFLQYNEKLKVYDIKA